MKRIRTILAVLAVSAVTLGFAVSSGLASTSKVAAPAGAALTLTHNRLGDTLTDGRGRALYLFQPDRANVSVLSREGFAVWPAFTGNSKPRAEGGVSGAHVGVIMSAGGRHQVTYYGHPLYYYVGDQAPGATNGQDLDQFGGRWYLVSARGRAVTSHSTSASAAPQSTW